MAHYASRSGYRLEKVFTERPERPDAFASLVDAVIRDGVTCVLIPGEEHLRSLAVTADLKARLERAADLRILPLGGN
ncbi:hypothetical protein [Kribbella sp. NPDC051718]|uniref:hypothetical protein n=1 Tax=Kribbella sp. NPDC051718 TaxID=3155168 RepID=UPI00342E1285